jgi:tetratricopeptide (TPR) repeat protein
MYPVFLSYARSSSREAAESLYAALGGADGVAFLDSSDIEAGERIPAGLVEALLGARVIVVFADRMYFSRWYCLREWDIALAAFDALVRRSATQAQRDVALDPIVIALPPGGIGREELEGLPPGHRSTNWLAADDTAALADLVRRRLDAVTETLGERLGALGELDAMRATVVEQAAIPPPGNFAGATMYPPRRALDDSLGDGFVGRADELWRIHHRLWRMRGGASGAALTGGIEGGAGFGKTRLATEYFHRFGPQTYVGGLFWVNAETPLERQFHGILRELKPEGTPDLETFRQEGRDAEVELGEALHQLPPEAAVLYVVDNVPEPGPGEFPSRLSTWCPGLGDVTLLVTSRARQAVMEPIIRFPIDVLSPDAAVALLTREVREARSLEHDVWLHIAEWVGSLPLALELLNAALVTGAIVPAQLLAKVIEEPIEELDQAAETLRELVPAGAVRGITEALRESYLRLRPEVQRAARLLAQLAPDPIPHPLLDALGPDAAPDRVKGMLVSRSFVAQVDSADERVSMFGRMHQLLADFLRAQSDEEETELEVAARAVVRVFYRNNRHDPAAWPLLDACRPHAERLCRRLKAVGPDEDEIASLNQFLRLQQFFGPPTGDLFDDLIRLPPAQEVAHKNVSLQLELGLVLGDLLTAEGLWSPARRVYETAAALALAALDVADPATLTARSGLGETLRELGEFREARALQEEVLAVTSRRFGENDSWTRDARTQLTTTLIAAGHIKEALALQKQGASEHPDEKE